MSFERRIFSNSIWMILEKFLGIFGLIFVNSYMAKYIGPENFGKLAFVTSIFIFLQTVAWFGSQNILFKRLSKNRKSGVKLALSTQNFRQYLYFISSIIALTYLWFFSDELTFIFGVGNFFASYFVISDIFSIYNNSQLISYVNAFTNILGLFFALLLRFILVSIEADIYTMVFPVIVLAFFPYFLRKIYFYYQYKDNYSVNYKKRYNKYIFNAGGSLVLSTLSIALYTQISNIFLAQFSSFSDLGVYNVAMALGGAWGFINIALITSYFSKIYSDIGPACELRLLKQVHVLVLVVSFIVFFVAILLGQWFIELFYGIKFIQAVEILPYIVVATMLSAFGTISYRYIVKYSGYKYLSVKMLLVSLFSIPLSYFLIRYYGVVGAAICFVLIEFVSLTIANYFFRNGFVFKMHLKIVFK